MSRIPKLSGVVLAHEDVDCIVRCVTSLASVCAEVVVLYAGSSDDTVDRAVAAGARVERQPWLGDFAQQANAAIALARQPWVLLLDTDEWLDPAAADGLRTMFATSQIESAEIWTVAVGMHFLGKKLRFGGAGREAVERLFRQPIRYWPAKINPCLDHDGMRVAAAAIGIERDVARTEAGYRETLANDARLFAEGRIAAKKRSAKRSAVTPYAHAGLYLVKSVVLRGGFLDGAKGWRYHRSQAQHVFDKYRLLRELATAG